MKTASAMLALGLFAAAPAIAAPADDARAAAARGDRAAAIAAWQEAIVAEPEVPGHYEALGREHLRARDYPAAVQTFRRLVEAVPDHPRGRYRLAFALRKADRLDEAALAYRDYIAVAPNDPDGHFGLARTLEKLGQGTDARAAYIRYVELEKRPSEAKWVEQARARIATLTPAPTAPAPVALPPVDAAPAGPVPATAGAAPSDGAAPAPAANEEALLGDSPVAQATPAADPDAAFAAGRYASAAAGYLQRLAEREAPGLRYRAAVAATLAGDAVLASAQIRSALGGAPNHAAGLRLARANAGEFARRRQSMTRVAAVDAAMRDNRLRTAARLAGLALQTTEDPTARAALRWARGRALARLGRHDEALVELKQAASVQPADPWLWAELGDVAARRGERAAAAGFLEIAAAIAPAGHPLARSTPQTAEAR